jgi:hypothetical protein
MLETHREGPSQEAGAGRAARECFGWFHVSISLCSCVWGFWFLPLHHQCDASVDLIFRKNLAGFFVWLQCNALDLTGLTAARGVELGPLGFAPRRANEISAWGESLIFMREVRLTTGAPRRKRLPSKRHRGRIKSSRKCEIPNCSSTNEAKLWMQSVSRQWHRSRVVISESVGSRSAQRTATAESQSRRSNLSNNLSKNL